MTKIPSKSKNYQNNPKTYKMTKIPSKPKKMTKISRNPKNDQNTPQNPKNDQNIFWVLGYFGHILGFWGILVIFRFGGILVIFEDFRVLCSFSL